MRSVCQALNLLTTTLGSIVGGAINSVFSFWISSNLNQGHLENVFFIISGIALINFLGFVIISQSFEYHDPTTSPSDSVSGFSPALPRTTRHLIGLY